MIEPVLSVSDGHSGERDMVKQGALYIDLDKSCRAKNAPIDVTREDAEAEYKRAERYETIVRTLLSVPARVMC